MIKNPVGVFSFVVPVLNRPSSNADLFALQIIYRAEAKGTPVAEIDGSTDLVQWWSLREIENLPLVALVGEALDLADVSYRSALAPPGE
ncbi:MAG: hypothetical protein ACRDWA_07145 [Acidimicrobiia bacterium]